MKVGTFDAHGYLVLPAPVALHTEAEPSRYTGQGPFGGIGSRASLRLGPVSGKRKGSRPKHRWVLEPATHTREMYLNRRKVDGELYLVSSPGRYRRGNVKGQCHRRHGCQGKRLFHPFTRDLDPLALLAG